MLALLLALLLGLAGVAPAVAGPVSGGWHTGAGVAGTGYFVGQHRNAEGLIAYCTDFERFSPDHASGYTDGNAGPFVRSDGTTLSAEDNSTLAFVLGRWGATADNEEAASVQLAVWSLTATGMGWDTPSMDNFIRDQELALAVASRARAMVEQARAEAGPYSISASFIPVGVGGRVSATILSADGTPRPGLRLEAVASGASFVDGSTTSAWTSGIDPHVLDVRPTGFGGARVTITASSVPATNAAWLAPREPDVQRLVVAPVSADTTASVDLPFQRAFAPEVTTSTSIARTSPGTPVHDLLDVSVASPGQWLIDPASGEAVELDVVSTLWGPLPSAPAESPTVPAGTPSIGTVTTRVSGAGSYQTPPVTVPSAGFYVWTESIDPRSARPAQAAPLIQAWSGPFGLPLETTLVPWQPRLTTTLSQSSAPLGAVVHDTVAAEGFDTADDGDLVRLTMYGPLAGMPAESPSVPGDAPVHSHTDVPAANGTVTSENFGPLEAPGCYTVVASFSGSSTEEPFVSAFGIPDETVCVEEPPAPAPVPDGGPPVEHVPAPAPAQADASPGREQQLARTGVSAATMAGSALIALGLGVGLSIAARRRTVR
ncbi:hypothetical protein [Arthrobacter sp. B1805]|uniref:hypothetical protein n=1 Tax=Arthrobacter sp. B1805 TaxID=2058892 RepID=UPI000CE3C893|nr:hypothetical protein [Arthrobacter sp. B1805]